jgi:hypothetical protein
MDMQKFNCAIQHVPGTENVVADALSRSVLKRVEDSEVKDSEGQSSGAYSVPVVAEKRTTFVGRDNIDTVEPDPVID